MNGQFELSLVVDIFPNLLVAKRKTVGHVQFAMLWKLRAMYIKNWELSPAGVKKGAAFANRKYRVRQTSCLAQLEWFHNFLHGLEFRMGCQSDPTHRLLMRAIVNLVGLIRANAEAEEAGLTLDANKLWKVGIYFCILMAASLKGYKGFYLELASLWKHLEKGRFGVVPLCLDKSTIHTEEIGRNLPHVTTCLLCQFKEETRTDHHMIALANNTIS
jgi:hypothetical protein